MNTELFFETLPIMAKGMLGVFAVTAVLIASILILRKVSARGKQ